MSFSLNSDVLMLIMEHLDHDDLLRLACTCRHLNTLVHNFACLFLRNNQRQSITLHSSRSRWSPLTQVRYNTLADRAWSCATFIARPLARPWHGNRLPVIALSVSTLLVAAGRALYSYAVRDTSDSSPSCFVFERSYIFTLGRGATQSDITSLAFLPGQDRTAFIGFEDGFVERVHLPAHDSTNSRQQITITRAPKSATQQHDENVVKSLSCSPHALLSLAQWGSVSLTNLSSDIPASSSLNLGVRSWASHLCMSSPSPYAVFGTTSPTPLSLHYIAPHGLSPTPSITLQSPKNRPSAVYGITCAPLSSSLGPSEQIIISGWYDGSVRVYDLRLPCQSPRPTDSSTPTPLHSTPVLLPALTLKDPWTPDPIYAVSCGGGNASFVAAGMARHSVVAFWDVRQPSRGWSVHAPGNDPSPVYSLILESSRLIGATQSRPFIYDFGPGVTKYTYPPISFTAPAGRRGVAQDRLEPEKNGIGYRVSKYSHLRTGII